MNLNIDSLRWNFLEDIETVKVQCEYLELGRNTVVSEQEGSVVPLSGHQGVVMSQRSLEDTTGSRADWGVDKALVALRMIKRREKQYL